MIPFHRLEAAVIHPGRQTHRGTDFKSVPIVGIIRNHPILS